MTMQFARMGWLCIGLLGSVPVLVPVVTPQRRIGAGVLGPTSPSFRIPVPNALSLVEEPGRTVVVGETGPTADYQLESEPIAVSAGTKMVRVRLTGEIETGGMYYAILGEGGSFLGPPRVCYAGPVDEQGPILALKGSRFVRIALGNLGQGVRSRWRIERIELVQSARLDLEELGFSRSSWRWALDVLRGNWRPSKKD